MWELLFFIQTWLITFLVHRRKTGYIREDWARCTFRKPLGSCRNHQKCNGKNTSRFRSCLNTKPRQSNWGLPVWQNREKKTDTAEQLGILRHWHDRIWQRIWTWHCLRSCSHKSRSVRAKIGPSRTRLHWISSPCFYSTIEEIPRRRNENDFERKRFVGE